MFIIGAIVLIASIGVMWWYLHRDPERADAKFNGYVSPANGIVVDIIERDSKTEKAWVKKGAGGISAWWSDFPRGKTIIVIMMKPQHIHTQRAPVAGIVKRVVHRGGKKLNAVFGSWERATVENEHALYVLGGKKPCAVYAIAGLLARRVRPLAIVGQRVRQGERLAKITFGSQVALMLPKTKRVLVRVGDIVVDGVTPVAK
jgi:phosphatidylserine decarboxylase